MLEIIAEMSMGCLLVLIAAAIARKTKWKNSFKW